MDTAVSNETISKIATKDVITISIDEPLRKAATIFHDKHVRHLPVVDDNKLVGILSKTDVMRLSFGDIYGEYDNEAGEGMFDLLNIEQVMKAKPKTVNASADIREVAEILSKEEFHALPVMDGENLVGIVTTTDVIKYLLGFYR